MHPLIAPTASWSFTPNHTIPKIQDPKENSATTAIALPRLSGSSIDSTHSLSLSLHPLCCVTALSIFEGIRGFSTEAAQIRTLDAIKQTSTGSSPIFSIVVRRCVGLHDGMIPSLCRRATISSGKSLRDKGRILTLEHVCLPHSLSLFCSVYDSPSSRPSVLGHADARGSLSSGKKRWPCGVILYALSIVSNFPGHDLILLRKWLKPNPPEIPQASSREEMYDFARTEFDRYRLVEDLVCGQVRRAGFHYGYQRLIFNLISLTSDIYSQ